MPESIEPVDNDLSHPFWKAANEGKLVLPFCEASDRPFWPPSPTSPFAQGGGVEWREAEPRGRLVSRIVYRRGFQKALAQNLPYGIGLVELAAGVRICVHMPEPDMPESAMAGDLVQINFVPLVEGGQAVPIVTEAD